MNTLRQSISNIRGDARLLSSDIPISDRLIASHLRNANSLIITQELNKRKLWQSPSIFTPLNCIEMKKVPLSECCDYSGDKMLARSVLKFPQIGEGRFGLAIQNVSGLDGIVTFYESTPRRYANILKLNLLSRNIYYWFENDYLYVTNPDTELVKANIYFTDDVPNELLYPNADCKCGDYASGDECINPLDKPFRAPADRIKDIEDIALERLARYFIGRKDDNQTNNKED